jgi:hypothetical protein
VVYLKLTFAFRQWGKLWKPVNNQSVGRVLPRYPLNANHTDCNGVTWILCVCVCVEKLVVPRSLSPTLMNWSSLHYCVLQSVAKSSASLKTFSFFPGATAPGGPVPSHYCGFTITLRHTTLGRTPLDKWSAWYRDLYLTTHNTYKRHTTMPLEGFKPTFPASEQPQTHALDHAAAGNLESLGLNIY